MRKLLPSLDKEQVTLIVRAIRFVTGNLVNSGDPLVGLLLGLLSSLLLRQKDLVTREVNEEVLDVAMQCVEDKEIKLTVLVLVEALL